MAAGVGVAGHASTLFDVAVNSYYGNYEDAVAAACAVFDAARPQLAVRHRRRYSLHGSLVAADAWFRRPDDVGPIRAISSKAASTDSRIAS